MKQSRLNCTTRWREGRSVLTIFNSHIRMRTRMNISRLRQRAISIFVSVLSGTLILPLVLTGLPPARATPDTQRDCEQAVATTVEEAFVLASACDTDIEILEQRTPWDTVYATPQGTTRAGASISAIRTDVNGEWEPVDTSLSSTPDGITVQAPVFPMTFSDGSADKPLATIVKDGHTLTMDAPMPLTTPIIEDRNITYPDVFNGVDLVLSVDEDGTGFSQVLRVQDATAASNPALKELTFPVEASSELALEDESGGFIAVDNNGETVFTSPQPLMWDSSTNTAPKGKPSTINRPSSADEYGPHEETQPAEGNVVLPVPITIGGDHVTIEPDQKMLTNKETSWPVYIDPAITANQYVRTGVMSGFPTSNALYNFADHEGIGYCNSTYCGGNAGVHRLVFGFGNFAQFKTMKLDINDIISATFRVYGTHSWSCNPTSVQLWVTGTISPTTTWNTQPTWGTLVQTKSVAHRSGCTNGNTPRWIEWDAKAAAQFSVYNKFDTATLGLKSVNENTMESSWQRYRYDAQLWVEYNRVPEIATDLTTDPATTCSNTGTTYMRSATPTFKWRVKDPDGTNVIGSLQVARVSDNYLIWAPAEKTQASQSLFSAQIPAGKLDQNVTYEWRARGRDIQSGKLGPAATCRFVIDSIRPDKPPTIQPTDGQSPRYTPGETSGGIGLTGSFTLGNAGVSDVKTYKYSFNSDALNKTTTATSGGNATITYTPSTSGSHTLQVQSVDNAGNTSDITTYTFYVNPSKPEAAWKLDEGTGTIATDSAGTNPLTVTAPWTTGAGADPTIIDPPNTNDKALEFTTTSHSATSARPAVNTTGNYTIMARVTTTQLTNAATIISQDGTNTAAFRLGMLPASQCASSKPCWTFQTSTNDSTTTTFTTVTSGPAETITANQWYHLTAVHDNTSNTLKLYVCPLPTAEQSTTQATTTTPSWNATGKTQLGRSRTTTGYNQNWQGRIDHIRIDNVALDTGTIRQTCKNGGDTTPPPK